MRMDYEKVPGEKLRQKIIKDKIVSRTLIITKFSRGKVF